jgi:DNA-binding ferritin-like protein
MVGSLVRYSDTHKFFEKHYDEIQEIRDELQES